MAKRRPLIVEMKTTPAPLTILAVDEKNGRADAIVNVFGIVDLGNDRIKNGAFRKTISERAGRIRVLDSHRMDTVRAVIGRPLEIKELDRAGLPKEVRDKFPEATGGLFTKTQYAINTFDGNEIFQRIVTGVVNEYSIGFDLLEAENVSEVQDGEEVIIRDILEVRLWEYSVVTFGMNQATQTVRSQIIGNPSEPGKLLLVREMDDSLTIERAAFTTEGKRRDCRVVGVEGITASMVCNNEADDISGFAFSPEHWERKDAIGWAQHNISDEIQLGINENGDEIILNSPPEPEVEKEMTDDGPIERLGDILVGHLRQTFSMLGDGWLISGLLSSKEHEKFVKASTKAINVFVENMPEAVMIRRKPEDFFFFGQDEPEVTKESNEPQANEAEPDIPLTLEAQKRAIDALRIDFLKDELIGG